MTESQGLSLHNAAREAGVSFSHEWNPESKSVKTNGLNFHYLEWGDPSKPLILMLHGFAQQAHSWDFVALAFADRFRIIALDQRGHGDSDWASDGDYTPETQQIDIAAIVQELSLDEFVLMGLSMGGRNSFTYAANNPEKVKALIIVDAGPENVRAGTQNIRRFVEQDDELDSIDAFVDRVVSYNPRRDPIQIRGSIVNNLRELPNGKWTWKYDKILRSPGRMGRAQDPDMTKRLWGYVENLNCPTLVVRGDRSDIIATDTADEMQKRIPNGKLAIIENAGHLVMGDNPSGFEKAVTKFISNL
ncbi:MAG: alpha/beta hydrolase [SAR202 cluster bacterium]|jgi:pimeloyl-ACP methyl ester carboxylesterase|nr:alpha/beta hydrolase [SAR202 cluster bacterium]